MTHAFHYATHQNFETKAVSDLVLEAQHPLYRSLFILPPVKTAENVSKFFFLLILKPINSHFMPSFCSTYGLSLICLVSPLIRPNLESILITITGRRCTLWMSMVSQSPCRRRGRRAEATGGGGPAAPPSAAARWSGNGRH